MSDEGLFVRFSLEARVDEHASAEDGKPKWVNREYITIHVPGDKTNVPHRPVEEKDKRRFARQYEAWKRGQEAAPEGQPLKEWAAISPAEVQMLAQANVYTVEQLANVSDANAQRVGPILALRDKARRHVEQLRVAAPVEALNAKMQAQERELADLRERLARLTEGQEPLTLEPTPRRRGRPSEPAATEA